MLKLIASIGGAAIVSTIFYSALTISSITVFDVLSLSYSLVMLLIYQLSARKFRFPVLLEVPFSISLIMVTSFFVSLVSSSDPIGHLTRSAIMIAVFFNMFIFAYIMADSGYLSRRMILNIICISGAISSIFSILQGQFGHFLSIIPSDSLEQMQRFPGLAGHPVEAGGIEAYTGLLAFGNVLDARSLTRKIFWGTLAVITLYSIQFSLSLTGLLTLAGAVCVLLVVRTAWRSVLVIAFMLLLIVPIVASSSFFATSPLYARLTNLFVNGQNFDTVESRSAQTSTAISLMLADPKSLIFGFGFSDKEFSRLYDLEIHNGLVGFYYHFGIFGLVGQLFFLLYIARSMLFGENKECRSISACIAFIFLCAYMTGPATYLRRSIWMLPILDAMAIRAQSMEAGARRSRANLANGHESQKSAQLQ
jgi:hypothetical protein